MLPPAPPALGSSRSNRHHRVQGPSPVNHQLTTNYQQPLPTYTCVARFHHPFQLRLPSFYDPRGSSSIISTASTTASFPALPRLLLHPASSGQSSATRRCPLQNRSNCSTPQKKLAGRDRAWCPPRPNNLTATTNLTHFEPSVLLDDKILSPHLNICLLRHTCRR